MNLLTAVAACMLLCMAAADERHDPTSYVFRDHSLILPYYGDQGRIPHWNYRGSTLITDQFIRLTPDQQSRKGSIWNSKPFVYYEPNKGFEITLNFKVHGAGKKLFGDGFAVWFTEQPLHEGPVFGSDNPFKGMGVFFDTYSNVQQSHQQYVSVMLNDGTQVYDHNEDGGASKLAGCHTMFRGFNSWAKIVYHNSMLRVYVDTSNSGWEECFIVRRVHLPSGYYFGISAATGDLADNHDIISFKVSEPTPMSPEEEQEVKRRISADVEQGFDEPLHHDPQYVDGQHSAGGLSWTMIAIGVFALGVVIIVIAIYAEKKKGSSRRSALPF